MSGVSVNPTNLNRRKSLPACPAMIITEEVTMQDLNRLPMTSMISRPSEELLSIQAQITKWLSNYGNLVTQNEFVELLQKIVPFVKQREIKELFHSIDYENSGAIKKQLLLQNNYLATLIQVIFNYLFIANNLILS